MTFYTKLLECHQRGISENIESETDTRHSHDSLLYITITVTNGSETLKTLKLRTSLSTRHQFQTRPFLIHLLKSMIIVGNQADWTVVNYSLYMSGQK